MKGGEIALIVIACIGLIAGLMFGLPAYAVWQKGMAGLAELRQAEQNKQIRIEEARSQYESAKFLADAEIERARGVAKANEIIADSLKGNDVYLRYLWVQTLSEPANNRTIIYVPTEGQLPILEAGRLLQ
jgi:regulator of protease activity HflC (stomatin/prohibitin superfamily)